MRLALTILAILFCCGLPGAPALGEVVVVVESTAPDLAPGQALDGGQPLELPEGSAVTLVTRSGEVISLEGPYEGVPAGAEPDPSDGGLLDALVQLLKSGDRSSAPAVTRGMPLPDLKLDLWSIRPGLSRHHCVPADQPVTLRRWRGDEDTVLELEHSATGGRAEVRLAPGVEKTPWPEALPLEEGSVYRVVERGSPVVNQLILHRMPADLPGKVDRLVWLVQHNCTLQARALWTPEAPTSSDEPSEAADH